MTSHTQDINKILRWNIVTKWNGQGKESTIPPTTMNLRVTPLYVTEMVVELHGAANLEQFKTFGTKEWAMSSLQSLVLP